MDFEKWLSSCTKADGKLLSARSAEHYASGVLAISKDMIKQRVIAKPLDQMELYELDIAIAIIFKNSFFIAKNKKGNNMYSNALKRYRCYAYLTSEQGKAEETAVKAVEHDLALTETERQTIIKARIGQGSYRDKLIKKYDGRCVITGLSIKQTLIASHIKPWAVCSNEERTDGDNGLLLSATYDKLFDSGLITFKENGEIILSDLIPGGDAFILGIKSKDKFDIKFNANMSGYLQYHNANIFIGNI